MARETIASIRAQREQFRAKCDELKSANTTLDARCSSYQSEIEVLRNSKQELREYYEAEIAAMKMDLNNAPRAVVTRSHRARACARLAKANPGRKSFTVDEVDAEVRNAARG